MLYGQIRHVPEDIISTIHDEPPSTLRRLGLSFQKNLSSGYRISRSTADRLARRLPFILPITFFLFIALAQVKEVRAFLDIKNAPLSSLDSQRASLIISNHLDLETLNRAQDGTQLAEVALEGEIIGGATSDTQTTKEYVVQPGDTLSSIANSHDLHSATLREANNLEDSDLIHVGTVINIPDKDLDPEKLAAVQAKEVEQDKQEVAAVNKALANSAASKTVKASIASKKIASFISPTGSHSKTRGFISGHPGDDLVAPLGTPVIMPADGCVAQIGSPSSWNGGYGGYILTDHGSGVTTIMAHLKAQKAGLAAGQCFSQGQVVGYVGSTGNSTGPHVHFEVRINGQKVNPDPYY